MSRSRPKNKKNPKKSVKVKARRGPRTSPAILDISSELFRWRVDSADYDGPWGWKTVGIQKVFEDIIPKLQHFETMKWGTIEGSGSHFVSVGDCRKSARDRLMDISRDDISELFSLRLTGVNRIWGIRDKQTLAVLWWDPNHEVCPSRKKHT